MNTSKIVLNSKTFNTTDPKGIDQQNINYSDIYSDNRNSDSDSDSSSEYEETQNEYYTFSTDEKGSQETETDSESNFSSSDTEDAPKRKQASPLVGIKSKKKQTTHYKILQEDFDFE